MVVLHWPKLFDGLVCPQGRLDYDGYGDGEGDGEGDGYGDGYGYGIDDGDGNGGSE